MNFPCKGFSACHAATLDSAASNEQNLRKLASGRLSIFVNAVEPSMYVAQRIGLGSQVKILDWIAHDGHYFAAVSRKSPRIRDRVQFMMAMDDCVANMKKDGSFCSTFENHGLKCPQLNARPSASRP